MTHIFLSHSTSDGAEMARELCRELEKAGHRCWIAPRDVDAGVPYPGQIVAAIEACSSLVLVLTPAANDSPDVLQEVQLAATARKLIVPVVQAECSAGPNLRYYLGVRHQVSWSDAATVVRRLLKSLNADAGAEPGRPSGSSTPTRASRPATIDPSVRDLVLLDSGPEPERVAKLIWVYSKRSVRDAKRLSLGEGERVVRESLPAKDWQDAVQRFTDLGARVELRPITYR